MRDEAIPDGSAEMVLRQGPNLAVGGQAHGPRDTIPAASSPVIEDACWRTAVGRLQEGAAAQWPWLVFFLSGVVTLAFFWGYMYGDYRVSAAFTVINPDRAHVGVSTDAPNSVLFLQRLADELRGTEFAKQVASTARHRISVEDLQTKSTVSLSPVSEEITVLVRGSFPETLVASANTFASLGLRRGTEMWEDEVRRQRDALAQQLARTDQRLGELRQKLPHIEQPGAVVDAEREYADTLARRTELENKATALQAQREADRAKVKVLSDELQKQNPAVASAREALHRALGLFTDEHPQVKALRAALAQMEAEAATGAWMTNTGMMSVSNPVTVGLYLRFVELKGQIDAAEKELLSLRRSRDDLEERLSELLPMSLAVTAWRSQHQSLADCRSALLKRQNEFLLQENQAAADARILEPARIEKVSAAPKWQAGFAWGGATGLLGCLLYVVSAMALPSPERQIRSVKELQQATQLPVLASLGDVDAMDQAAQESWACETLGELKARVCGSHQGLMFGFISSLPGEGKSTWIRLLARAADQQGYRVVVVSNEPEFFRTEKTTTPQDLAHALSVAPTDYAWEVLGGGIARGAESPVCIPLAEWMWKWQHRKQFQQALANSYMIENLALFVELPAYSTPGGVTLAERIPNLIWLSRDGMASRQKLRRQVDTLRLSGGSLAGTVFNQANGERRKRPTRVAATALFLFCLSLSSGQAQDSPGQPLIAPTEVAKKTVASLSISSPDQLADWQKHLTLGPGDVLDISMYGKTDSARTGLVIGPDGRLNYLQARDFMAAGLTVEELRAEMEKVLAKFHLAPQLVVVPSAYRSKKYFLIGGGVRGPGAYSLERPTTIIEAIAKGKGFASGMQQQNVSLMVDLGRSFLVRKASETEYARVPVDFEGLFLRGDLGQNIALAPDDYLFFPPLASQEVYVLGEVRGPGVLPLTKDLTALGAIIARGGFTDRAWKSKVLVIRGSLLKPEPFVVNAADILKARGTDFKLANRDIVYVHMKPWAKGEELLERAAMTFANSVVMGYAQKAVLSR